MSDLGELGFILVLGVSYLLLGVIVRGAMELYQKRKAARR